MRLRPSNRHLTLAPVRADRPASGRERAQATRERDSSTDLDVLGAAVTAGRVLVPETTRH